MGITYLCFLMTALVFKAHAFSSGQVGLACGSMNPGHFPFSAQQSRSPYSLSATTNSGGFLEVTIQGPRPGFKGFFIQTFGGNGRRIGSFNRLPQNARAITCGRSGDSVSHRGSATKNYITVPWYYPPKYQGTVTFKATIVESYSKFWTDVTVTYTI